MPVFHNFINLWEKKNGGIQGHCQAIYFIACSVDFLLVKIITGRPFPKIFSNAPPGYHPTYLFHPFQKYNYPVA